MTHWQMYQKPYYSQGDTVWASRGTERPVKGQVLYYIGRRTYEVALSGQGVRVVHEQALSRHIKGDTRR